MKQKRYTEAQIRQEASGTPVGEIVRKMGVSEATFYRWKQKYDGLGVGEVRRLKQLVADLSLDKSMLQDALKEKL